MSETTLGGLIDIAIEREEAAHDFYTKLAEKVDEATVKDTLQFLAKEELKHKEFLRGYRDGTVGPETLRMSRVVDYRIAEHLEEPDAERSLDSKDAYLVAAHRELQSYRFYRALADLHPDGRAKELLLKMANEELKHKEKVEYLYANTAFPQTAGG